MRVGVEMQFQIFVALLGFPNRSERQEETLLRRQAVDFFLAFLRIFIERFLQCGIGELHAAQIGDVFALSQLTVDVQTRQRLVFVELPYDRL